MPRSLTGLWRHRDFLKLWSAKTVSDFGSMVSRTALSFTAILLLKATPAQLSLLMVANLLPKFLMGLPVGVWVDRLPRRPVMVLADLGRALLLVSIPVAALFGALHIAQLVLVTLLTGLLTLLFDIADRAYLPTLVSSEVLVEANSKLTATASVAEFSAFSLGGWLVQWFTGPIAVLIDALSFLFSALFLGSIRTPEPPPNRREEQAGMRRELIEGLTTVRDHPLLAALAASTLLLGLSFGIIGTVIVAFMARDLGFKPGVLGMIWSIGGITSLLGATIAGPLTRRIGIGPTLILGLLFSGIGVLAVPLAHGTTLAAAALLIANQVITDPAYTLYDINQMSLRQTLAPEHLQGRVNATLEFVSLGATLVGALLGGLLGQKLGLRSTLIVGATSSLLAALWLWLSPVRLVKASAPIRWDPRIPGL
jgi:MFS family permease